MWECFHIWKCRLIHVMQYDRRNRETMESWFMEGSGVYLHHFSVMAPSEVIERTMHFYRDVLGIKPGYRPQFDLPGYWLYAGDTPIIHLVSKNDRQKTGPGYFHHVALRCPNLGETIKRLSNANIEYRWQNLDDVQQIQLTVIDPAGNLVELNFLNPCNA